VPPQQARNLADELAATDLAQHTGSPRAVAGRADDIDFSACLEYQLARIAGSASGSAILRRQRVGHAEDRGRPGQCAHKAGSGH